MRQRKSDLEPSVFPPPKIGSAPPQTVTQGSFATGGGRYGWLMNQGLANNGVLCRGEVLLGSLVNI